MLKRQYMEWKHMDSLVKKRLQAQQSVKKVMLTVFLDMKKPITIDFIEKCAIVNSASNSLDNISPYLLNGPYLHNYAICL